MDRNLQVTIIVLTLNEIDGMKWFMPRLKKEWYNELIIADGGSTDGTVEFCRANGYPLFIQSDKGPPNACDEAFMRSKGDIIVFVTPDGNSIPEIIPQLAHKIRQGYELVIASRYLKPAKSYDDDILTKFGNRMFTAMINFLFKGRYTDAMVGFRAYQRKAIYKMHMYKQEKQGWFKKRFVQMNSWDPGSSIRAAKLKLKVSEIPADEPRRIGGKRKLSIIKAGFGVLFQILHEFIMGCNFPTKI